MSAACAAQLVSLLLIMACSKTWHCWLVVSCAKAVIHVATSIVQHMHAQAYPHNVTHSLVNPVYSMHNVYAFGHVCV